MNTILKSSTGTIYIDEYDDNFTKKVGTDRQYKQF